MLASSQQLWAFGGLWAHRHCPAQATTVVEAGPLRLVLAATDSTDVDWCVRLFDVDQDGRSKLLNTGALKGSHVHSHDRPEPLHPSQEYTFDIEVWHIANFFRREHRIRIDVLFSDFPFFEVNRLPAHAEVLHGPAPRSRLLLPRTR